MEREIFIFLNAYLPVFSDPQNPENVRPHSNYSIENVTPQKATPSSGTGH